jgi:hypothetical protein
MRAAVLLLLLALLAGAAPPHPASAGPRDAQSLEEVFSLDAVHAVALRIDPDRVWILDADRSIRVPCEVTIDGTTYVDAEIKEKGSGSSSTLAGKPGFTISFGKEHPRGLDKLTLNNAVQDPSLLHEHLAYELYRRAGVPAPRTAHATVTLNGRPYGVYVMVESVDKEFLERAFGEGNGKGNLYEGAGSDFVDDAALGGSEWGPGYFEGNLELKDADEGRTRADLQALVGAALAPDEGFADAILTVLDLDRFITAYALDALLAHWDGPMFSNLNNYYLYANPADGRFVLLPHGVDQVFDATFDPLTPPRAVIARRVRSVPALDARFRGELNRLVARVWDVEVLLARTDRAAAALRAIKAPDDAAARDLALFEGALEGLRAQVVGRPARWRPV